MDRLKGKRNQARQTPRRVQLHSHRLPPVNRPNRACLVHSPQWDNSLPAVPTPFSKDPLPNRHWPMHSRRPCLVHTLSDKVHRWVHISRVHLNTKVLRPDQLLTRSRKLRSSKGCSHRRDSNKLHTLVLISPPRLQGRKCKHRDRHLLRLRNLLLLQHHRQTRLKLQLLSLKDLLLLLQVNRHSHLLHRAPIRRLNKPLRLLNRLLRRLQWLKMRLLLNIHLRHRQLQFPFRHSHRRLLLQHSNRRLQMYPQPLHQLQWLLRHLLHNLRQHSLQLLQLLRRRQHQWHRHQYQLRRRLQRTRTHMVV